MTMRSDTPPWQSVNQNQSRTTSARSLRLHPPPFTVVRRSGPASSVPEHSAEHRDARPTLPRRWAGLPWMRRDAGATRGSCVGRRRRVPLRSVPLYGVCCPGGRSRGQGCPIHRYLRPVRSGRANKPGRPKLTDAHKRQTTRERLRAFRAPQRRALTLRRESRTENPGPGTGP